MSKSEKQPRQDSLVENYREIGPAALAAALLNAARRNHEKRKDNQRPSILAVKKPV
ncbi:hydrolase [Brucellaceae bacterium D45D]